MVANATPRKKGAKIWSWGDFFGRASSEPQKMSAGRLLMKLNAYAAHFEKRGGEA